MTPRKAGSEEPPAPPKCSCGDTSCPGPCEHGGCVCEGPHDPNHQGYRQPDSAPPPCESYFPQLGYRFEEFCRTHVRPIHLCFEAKDEEIAELRALLVRIRNWRMDPVQVNYSLWFLDENGHPTRTLVEAIDAALAPKGGK